MEDIENNMNLVNNDEIFSEKTDDLSKNVEETFEESEDELTIVLHKRKINIINDEDDEQHNLNSKYLQTSIYDSECHTDIAQSKTNQKKNRIKRLFSSDSESSQISGKMDNEEVTIHNKSFTDNETDISANNSINNIENNQSDSENEKLIEDDEVITPIVYKRRSKKDNGSEPKKLSAKEAEELSKSIKSERQRRIRESIVSLPYHKPKSHSLQEFLSRRSTLKSVFPEKSGLSPAMAIKMSEEELKIVTQRIKEREKEIKEFYKSESEDESDNDKDYNPESNSNEENESDIESNLETAINDNTSKKVPQKFENSDCDLIETPNIQNSLTTENVSNGINLCENNISDALENDIIENEIDKNSGEALKEDILHEDIESDETVNKNYIHECEKISEVVDSGNIQCNSEVETYAFKIGGDEVLNSENTEKEKENTGNVDSTFSESCVVQKIIDLKESNLDKQKETNDNLNNDSYEFNLDTAANDNEEAFNLSESERTINKEPKKFEISEIDKEIANFEETIEEQPKLKIKELLKEKLANIQPRLSGRPMEVIDLESGVVKPNEISELIDRFAKHTSAKKHNRKHDVEISLTTVESSGSIHKETMIFNIESEEEIVEEKPHAKHKKLKTELENKMIQKRLEMWEARNKKSVEEEEEILDDAILDEEGENDDEDEIEDKEVEVTATEEDELVTEEEEEEEEEDTYIQEKGKKKEKSEFVDDEAEVSDEDDYEGDLEDDDEEMAVDQNKINKILKDQNTEPSEDENIQKHITTVDESKKKLKRIIVESDSESETEDNLIIIKDSDDQNIENKAEGENASVHVTIAAKTPQKKTSQSTSEFLTPIAYNQAANSTSKLISKDSPGISPFHHVRHEPSPLKESNWQPNLQKKLFSEDNSSQSAEEQIESATLPESSMSKYETSLEEKQCDNLEISNIEEDYNPTTQELAGICSGNFTGLTGCQSEIPIIEKIPVPEIKNSEDDLIISQLLDEEELENFKKKFESPLYATNSSKLIIRNAEEVKASGGILDSDDDDEETIKIKKKNQKKLTFSDDEKDCSDDEIGEEEEQMEEETIDLHDDLSEAEDEPTSKIVYYDSEENEIELDDEVAKTANDFFEKEAELSESEWGSADEDEKDLDKYEIDEEAEAEKINEDKLKSDLERMHMRQILDEDNREVKLLQELLLEDGELHGTGRQKQFRWRNIDNIDDTDDRVFNNEDVDDIIFDCDEESEEQWRKQRHEREKFLSEQMQKSQDLIDDFLSGSQLLKIGKKVLKKTEGSSQKDEKIKEKAETEIKTLKIMSKQRGSFLNRSNQVLERLAASTKITTVGGTTIKNSRNFLFQSVSLANSSDMEEKKRKATDNTGGTPAAIKKLRLNSSLLNSSPASGSLLKKSSTLKSKKPNTSKKLFMT